MRKRLDRMLRLLIVLNIFVVALLAGTMVADWLQILPTGTVSGSASPSASIETMVMGLAHIPTSNECVLCHQQGGQVKTVPTLGHPLAGWTACLVCHTNEKLGREAPGHTGIAQSECLNCHKEAKLGPPITQAHANLNKPCLDCHGSVAHLPSTMAGRDPADCWLCHKPNPSPPPEVPHPYRPDLTCRSCHQASDVGALPIDHALRADDTCVLCHEEGAPSTAPGRSPGPIVTPGNSPVPSSSPGA